MNTTNSLLHNLGKRIKRVMVGKVGVVEGGWREAKSCGDGGWRGNKGGGG